MNYKNKVVIVTGSGRGIGRTIAIQYAAAGAKVIITDKSSSLSEETFHHIKKIQAETRSSYQRM